MTASPPQATLDWLLEEDAANPGVRYFALRDLLDLPRDGAPVIAARRAVMESGPVPAILAAQQPEGYWQKAGAGYSPKYRGTVWQLVQLERLGADPADARVRAGCEYVLEHTQTSNGGFGCSGSYQSPPPPSSVIHCLNGNLLAALVNLGWLADERVRRAVEWQARSITGDGAELRYYKSMTSGPGFACGVNVGQPCGWGANKAIRALVAIPDAARTDAVRRALAVGAAFLLSRDPAVADYPYTERVSSTWQHLGLPLSYWSDVLETLENLVALGYGSDGRLDHAFELILSKRDASGRWRLENTLNGKTWVEIEARGRPSKWVTLRALSALRRAGRLPGA
ncbi:MAG TPA: nitrogen fixation protein NifH [Dehalococcoidia bacterium]|nr:nitrogen fixation protein NifH [Dehalococcoidia bacterium]